MNNNIFTIRHADKSNLPEILKIYENARAFMKANGNESQWGLPSPGKKLWPSQESILEKMEKNLQYICETEVDNTTVIAATFAFFAVLFAAGIIAIHADKIKAIVSYLNHRFCLNRLKGALFREASESAWLRLPFCGGEG